MTRRQQGFTLMEIMVVVALIGIMMSVVSFRFTGQSPAEKLKTEAIRLEALIEIVLEEALYDSKEFGMHFSETEYEFHVFDEESNEFTLIENDKMLRKRELPEPLMMEVEAEGLLVDDLLSSENLNQPQMLLYSSGEISPPFKVIFRSPDTDIQYVLEASGAGNVDVNKAGSDL